MSISCKYLHSTSFISSFHEQQIFLKIELQQLFLDGIIVLLLFQEFQIDIYIYPF